MSTQKRDGLYIYQPYGTAANCNALRPDGLFAVAGLPPGATVTGLTRAEAETVLAALTPRQPAPETPARVTGALILAETKQRGKDAAKTPALAFRTCKACGSAENRRASETRCYCGVDYETPAIASREPSPTPIAPLIADLQRVCAEKRARYGRDRDDWAMGVIGTVEAVEQVLQPYLPKESGDAHRPR